jgi:hypothetical protein
MPSRNPVLVLVALLAAILVAAPAHAHYEAMMGRFLQPDPYATGMVVQRDPGWFHGRAPMSPVPVAPDLQLHYWNGMNHYECLGSNPPMRRDPLGLYYNDLRPGQLLGPGWSQGGVIRYDPRAARAAQASRGMGWARGAMQGALDGAVEGAWQEVLTGTFQIMGAGFAHVLYGQDGPAGADVWGATYEQIRKRMLKQALRQGGQGSFSWFGSGVGAGYDGYTGNYFGAASNIIDAARSLIGEETASRAFRSAAARISAIGTVAAGLYTGILEYMVNDTYNWGFGVRGKDLYSLWDGWD